MHWFTNVKSFMNAKCVAIFSVPSSISWLTREYFVQKVLLAIPYMNRLVNVDFFYFLCTCFDNVERIILSYGPFCPSVCLSILYVNSFFSKTTRGIPRRL